MYKKGTEVEKNIYDINGFQIRLFTKSDLRNSNQFLSHPYWVLVVESPLKFANIKEGETVVDLGSGAWIDAFLASKSVKDRGRVIGIDFTAYTN